MMRKTKRKKKKRKKLKSLRKKSNVIYRDISFIINIEEEKKKPEPKLSKK
jgi:hypothetical protein